jgi:endonuclease/exonuclease/phosphatase family metal-dependent hydrolase
MRVMTYNVHGCVGMDGKRSYERIAAVISQAAPDVVALQELDAGRARSGHSHQAQILADLLRMQFHFHPALRVRDEEYGDAILSQFPMTVVRSGALPRGRSLLDFEPRGALWVAIDVGTHRWNFYNTHLGLGRQERYKQALALSGEEWLAHAPAHSPVVLCGDLNSRPTSRVLDLLRKTLQDAQLVVNGRHANTFSTGWEFICLDYILASHNIAVRSANVHKTAESRVASDHFPLIADLEVVD